MTNGQKIYEHWREYIIENKREEPGDWVEDLYPHERDAWEHLAKTYKETKDDGHHEYPKAAG
jgi:hypothetical protein